uniref:Mitochondrial 2-oxoglutarate/malate carrier protein n=1 Tax=Chromera velia CCMP2878 TaxID=1169474 RepID=A0A0G4FZT9_9ALVE|mmetsp:Transcript_13216/g.26054  ORF Transcript_13216/g.26054 Transcript_13216/m.26054 type:complete len:300 (+) Transcript_13216:171-1070(+)|eukprot:Cvel_19419.t1-p1 / transcript=Cvel_19419.t1 / gene=Cvel_19419 / organism=Chromera_velia_CCMP2878 / gene_product=Mitochondrial dicarboxylate/tricarboxylate, putative / transcript_product=Mitochondrial dicarboxylate/tricarboxylate, putative / location=Cvel_scaffold1672:23395-26986(-) / protein_length=299 / sequence_SO=supercontig / SO=protein_coding / is_pseudo=false
MTDSKAFKTAQPFIVGGLSGCIATCCVQPIDMVKVRIQLATEGGATGSKNPIVVAGKLIKEEGFMKLYRGLDAGIIRQLTYTTARLGIFRVTSNALKKEGETTIPLWKKAFAGLFAGALGSVIGNPADLSLIRMQADGTLPPEQRRNYTGVFNAMSRITQEEGVLGLWKGCAPTVYRAMALNLGMLASYDQAKEMLTKSVGPGMVTNLTASAISGFFAVTFSLPFDFVKTRIQKQQPDAAGNVPYRSTLHCFTKVMAQEGPLAFYAGYPTYYVRIAPHAMITLLAVDALNNMIKKSQTK